MSTARPVEWNSHQATPLRIPRLATENQTNPSPAPNHACCHSPSKSGKGRQSLEQKKSSTVLGFFKLKEPSTSALEDFAEHERKRVARKGIKSHGSIMPGVSSQKLPNHVPKVNSKWDGLPEGSTFKAKSKKGEASKGGSIVSLPGQFLGSFSDGSSPRRRQEGKYGDTQTHALPRSEIPSLCIDGDTVTPEERSPRTPAADMSASIRQISGRASWELDGTTMLWSDFDTGNAVASPASAGGVVSLPTKPGPIYVHPGVGSRVSVATSSPASSVPHDAAVVPPARRGDTGQGEGWRKEALPWEMFDPPETNASGVAPSLKKVDRQRRSGRLLSKR